MTKPVIPSNLEVLAHVLVKAFAEENLNIIILTDTWEKMHVDDNDVAATIFKAIDALGLWDLVVAHHAFLKRQDNRENCDYPEDSPRPKSH